MARASPMRLLNDAGLATVRNVPDRRWAAYCLVVVFPYEPVIATTLAPEERRRLGRPGHPLVAHPGLDRVRG